MLRAPYSPRDNLDSVRKAIRTVKGSVVYGRKKHEIAAKDCVRMVKRLGVPTKVEDCDAQWELLALAIDQVEAMLPLDSVFVVRVETQRQVFGAMRAYVAEHPQCFGVGDVAAVATESPYEAWLRKWFPGLVKPFKP